MNRADGVPRTEVATSEAAGKSRVRQALRHGWVVRSACLAAALGVTYVFFIQYCDLWFDCGCRALWAGRAEHCNIHNAAPPHCPWCLGEGEFGWWTHTAVAVTQVSVTLWPGHFGALRVVGALLAFPLVGGLGAVLAGLASGYWG